MARDENGVELSASKVTNADSAVRQEEINKQEFGDSVSQSIENVGDVVEDRKAQTTSESSNLDDWANDVLAKPQSQNSLSAETNQDLESWADGVLKNRSPQTAKASLTLPGRANIGDVFKGQAATVAGSENAITNASARSPLNKISASENGADIQAQNSLRATPNKIKLLPRVESQTNGDTVKVSLEGGEILRVASALLSGEDVRQSNLFSGLYLDKQDVADYTDALDELGTIAEENGASRAPIDKLRNDINQAAAENGTAIIDVYSNAVPHERVHQAADLGSQTNGQSKQYLDRYHAPERIEADGSFQKSRDGLNRLENRNVSTGEAVEEAFAYLGTRDHEQFGLSEAQAADLLEKIILSYVEKNGIDSLQSFSRTEIEKVYESIEESKRQNAAREGGSENQSPERGGAGSDGRQARPHEAAKQSAAVNSSRQNATIEYFPNKSGNQIERVAHERIERIGLAQALSQATNPRAEQNAEHAALQTETINLLNRQAQEMSDKAVRRAKLDQSLEILFAMPLNATQASNALDQLAATADVDPDALTRYIERRRPAVSPALTETELKPLVESAAKLASLNAQKTNLENRVVESSNDSKRALKMAIPSLARVLTNEQTEAQREAEQLNRQRRLVQRQMLNRIKTLDTPPAGYAARIARVYKAMLVSAVQTTVNNILTAEGARKIESLSDLTEIAINKTLARLG